MTGSDNRDLPAAHEVDVLVIGGGPAGVGAAFAAARNGMRTLVVEQFNCLGGVATAGGHGEMYRYTENGNNGRRIVGGIAWELAERAVREGFGSCNGPELFFEIEGMKFILEKMAQGIPSLSILYHSFFCETIVQDGRVAGVVIQNKSGRETVLTRLVIDCTGDGDVAASAGCPWEMGRTKDGLCQPVTLMFTIGGVDFEKVRKFRNDEGAKGDRQLKRVWEEAQKNGDMEPFQKTLMGWNWTPTRPDHVNVNFTHVNRIDSTRAEDLTRATIEARKQTYQTVAVFRKYIPGMENCYLLFTPNTVGLRESRRILGEYLLTSEDVKNQKEFKDVICYGSSFIDIHAIDGPGMDAKTWYPPAGFKYHIPYRLLVPQKVDGLLTAGRCVSVTHVALGSIRMMVQCMAMGEAAGTAAALSLKDNVTPRTLDIVKLQKQLRRQGCILSEDDIAKAQKQDRTSKASSRCPDACR